MKVICTDLDGTLFYPKDNIKVISKKNLYFLQSFIDNGGKVVLVSGRSHSYGLKVKKIINRNVDIIAFNGASIYKDEEVIYKSAISNLDVKNIIEDIFNSFKVIAAIIFTDEGIYLRGKKDDSKIFNFCAKVYLDWQKNYAENFHIGKTKYQHALENSNIYKVLLFFGLTKGAKNRAMETNKILRNTYKNLEASWASSCIEITAKDISKGDAVTKYMNYCSLNKDDIYVVGDSGNDISMFKNFYENSFVMSHSSKVVKKYAKYTLVKFEDLSRYISKK